MDDLLILPLSAAQRELWLAQEVSGLQFGSVVSELFTIGRGLDEKLFRQSVDFAFRDIDSMKVRFLTKDGVLLQEFDPSLQLNCPIIDLVDSESPWTELHQWIARDAERSARMQEAPFCTMPLFRLAGGKYAWCVQAPHMVMDGYTGMLWVQRVAEIYNALREKRTIPAYQLGSLVDLLEEETKYRGSQQFEADRAFWMEGMSNLDPGAAATIALRDQQSRRGFRCISVDFDSAVNGAFADHSAKTGIQLSSLLFAAAAVYVSRISGKLALTVGLPVIGRFGRLARSTPGAMSNILPLRIDVHPDGNVLDLAREISGNVRRVLRHQRYRSEELRRDLKRTSKDESLFRVHLNYLSFDYGVKFGESTPEVHNLSTGTVDDVSFEFYNRHDGRGISIQMKFQESLYSPEESAMHSVRFSWLLKSIGHDLQQKAGTIALISDVERAQLVYGWNNTDAAYARDLCVHQLFEEQVALRPYATALVFEGEEVSYEDLNRQANQLAHHLRGCGVRPDDRVVVCLDRGLPMMIAILAVLKAGGAYVPVDPTHPAERLQFLLDDCRAAAVVTQNHLAESFAGNRNGSLPLLLLDDPGQPWGNQPDTNLAPAQLTAENLAYVIYTSGSTGTPKGVLVEHRQLVARLTGVRDSLAFGPSDTMPAVSSPAFDISVLETLLPLISGGTTHLTDARRIKDMDYLLEQTRSATVFNAVTSLMDTWQQSVRGEEAEQRYPALRALLVGGEPVSQRLLNQLSQRFPKTQIIETYGPTEATLYCTCCVAQPNSDITVLPPIGHPLPNTKIYILDAQGEPVPTGVAGEMYIGGASIARGYLNRPELTAERFRKDPFSAEPGARMYKSGDLGRWLPDGNIEFLGRNDFQVKLRGFRIELGEIEARLAQNPAVRAAVVLLREERLVAYLVAAEAQLIPDAATLRGHLSAVLPEYMVPAAYVWLDVLPLTPNGKLDRNSLPAPEVDAYSTRIYEEPQGETEILLARIWADLLHLERVGRHDNFFELGGHSLLAITLIERMRQYGLPADVRTLFSTPTLAQLALAPHSGAAQVQVPQNRIPDPNTDNHLSPYEVELTI